MARIAADLAVDLGSARSRVVVRGQGVVLDVPTVIATADRPGDRALVAIGDEAFQMMGRVPAGTRVVRPVRGGVVADFDATEGLLRALLTEAGGPRRPRVLICVPSGTGDVERRALQESVRAAGAAAVLVVPSPLAAALGAGLPIEEPVASTIIDLGAGRSHVAVLSLGGVVVRGTVPVAGDALDAAIAEWLHRVHGLVVGARTAETLKVRAASLTPAVHPDRSLRIRGRVERTGRPREVDVTAHDLADALDDPIGRIRRVLLDTLGECPPELAADIVDRGLLLCGGTSHLPGLTDVLRDDVELPVLQVDEPETCVARGAADLLDNLDLLERVATER